MKLEKALVLLQTFIGEKIENTRDMSYICSIPYVLFLFFRLVSFFPISMFHNSRTRLDSILFRRTIFLIYF